MAEKEYVLGNKTKDLLAYSFVVTKPIGDKTLEISEVIKMLGTIKSLPPEARDDILAQYLDRLEKANSRQGFPKSALHTYIKTVRETAVSIVKNVHAANDCSFQTEYDRRLDLIHAALNDCNLLLKLVEISQTLGYISVKRMGHWTKLITDVKYMTLAWKKKDTERAKALRRQEMTRDCELQASIIAGAVARALGRRWDTRRGHPPGIRVWPVAPPTGGSAPRTPTTPTTCGTSTPMATTTTTTHPTRTASAPL